VFLDTNQADDKPSFANEPHIQSRAVPRLRAVCAALLLAVVVALSVYAWRGWYTRYITDDFCTASALQKYGFAGAMKFHRQTWSGRYSYYVAKAIPEAIGRGTARFVPGVMIVLWCAAGVWTFRRITPSQPRVLAALSGVAVVFATIDGTPDVLTVGGPLVWETGVITYMLPLVLYTLWAGLFFGTGSILWRSVAAAVLLFAAGGLSETSLAGQGAVTTAVFLATILLRRSDLTRIAATGLVTTLLSLLLVVTAPGNAVRMLRLPPQPPLLSAVESALRLSYDYIGSIAFTDGTSLLLILFCGMALGSLNPRLDVRAPLLVSVAAVGAYIATFLPSTWMLGMGPPPRALHVTNFFLVATVLTLAIALGAVKPQAMRLALPILAALAFIAAIHSTVVTTRTIQDGVVGAAEMDRIDAIMRAHPGERMVIHSPWTIANRILVSEPEFWTNRCICDFYGVRALRITH